MATINYVYPHVEVSTTALKHKRVATEESTATVLFAPFCSDKGPDDKIEKIYSLDDFINIYGTPNINDTYGAGKVNYLNKLNIVNWLSSGGAVYAVRLTANVESRSTNKVVSTTSGNDTATSYPISFGTPSSNLISSSGGDGLDSSSYSGLNVVSKYKGSFYNNLVVIFTKTKSVVNSSTNVETSYANLSIYGSTGTLLERYTNITGTNMTDICSASEYLGTFSYEKEIGGTDYSSWDRIFNDTSHGGQILGQRTENTSGVVSDETIGKVVKIVLKENFTDAVHNKTSKSFTENDLIKAFYTNISEDTETDYASTVIAGNSSVPGLLSAKLETKIDVILDAGWPSAVKTSIFSYASVRDDIFYYFDMFGGTNYEGTNLSVADSGITNLSKLKNTAFFSQKFTNVDTISGNTISVGPSYYLSLLIPYNDMAYGIQYPVAGLTRGILEGCLTVETNPNASMKENYYEKMINYAEKDSRGVYFMSEKSYNDDETSLEYINNVRVLNRIVRELEDKGRKYLHEFNDSITLKSMRDNLTAYLNNWINNRTLAYGSIDVNSNAYNDNQVDISLKIRFNGVVEIIMVDITIE